VQRENLSKFDKVLLVRASPKDGNRTRSTLFAPTVVYLWLVVLKYIDRQDHCRNQ
jgi:hypothetical protein